MINHNGKEYLEDECICSWINWLYSSNWYNIANQLYHNLKNKNPKKIKPCVTKVKMVTRCFGNNDTLYESCQAWRGFGRFPDCAGRARFALWEHDCSLPIKAKTREGLHTPIHMHACVCTHVGVSYHSSSKAYCLWWHFLCVCGGRRHWKHVCSRCALAEPCGFPLSRF